MAEIIKKYAADKTDDDKANDERTTLSLSLTVADKKALKLMALEQNTTIAAIIHEWIQEMNKEGDK